MAIDLRYGLAEKQTKMEDPGEQLVGEYLRAVKNCDFIEYNLQTKFVQGEIDVVGIDSATFRVSRQRLRRRDRPPAEPAGASQSLWLRSIEPGPTPRRFSALREVTW